MKRILCLAALAGMAAMSHAQLDMSPPTNIAFRLGIGFPFDEGIRDDLGVNLFGFGVDYFFERAIVPGANGETYISGDWLSRGLGGDRGNMFPILLNQRWYAPDDNPDDYRRVFFNVGLGITVIDINSSDTVFTGRGGLGMEFGQNLFGEANVLISASDKNGFNSTGINLYLGYRF